jgi:hypothetical protein
MLYVAVEDFPICIPFLDETLLIVLVALSSVSVTGISSCEFAVFTFVFQTYFSQYQTGIMF